MAMLEPKLSILDETDSGLDIDALRIVAEGVNKLKLLKPVVSLLLTTSACWIISNRILFMCFTKDAL